MLVAVLPGVGGRIPRESERSPREPPWAASSAAHSVLNHLAQETPQLLLGPRLESKAKAKHPQQWWEVRLTISHTHGLSKVDLCVRPRHQKGSEESHHERVPHVVMLRPWPQVAAGP